VSARTARARALEATERIVTVRIEDLVFGGSGMGRLEDGRVIFVDFAAPGELVEAEIERISPDYVEAVTVRVLEPSPDRVEPRCRYFGQCGGCQLQHLRYEAQLAAKEAAVREQLQRIGRLDPGVVQPIVGARDPWGYRNHVRFSTGRKYGDVGFITRRGRRLLKVEECPIAHPFVNRILPELQGKGAGLHQIQVRIDPTTGEYLVYPRIEGVSFETGQPWYRERLAGFTFRVSASSFFQVNHEQAEALVRLIGEALPARGRLLVDAYAGVGTFAVIFANRFERVIAIEESPSAVRDAAENLTQAPNVEMREGKVEELLPYLFPAPDVILLDPPRAGCLPEALQAILRLRPVELVYVSCNPTTLARDLRTLVNGGYRLLSVTPLDMFPQTAHIECVAKLELGEVS